MMKLRLLLLKTLKGKNLRAAVCLRYVPNKRDYLLVNSLLWSRNCLVNLHFKFKLLTLDKMNIKHTEMIIALFKTVECLRGVVLETMMIDSSLAWRASENLARGPLSEGVRVPSLKARQQTILGPVVPDILLQ